MPAVKDLHVMEMQLAVRATQGITTGPGTEDWRVRGEQCQKLAEDCQKKKSLCWQDLSDLSHEGTNGKFPGNLSPSCTEIRQLPP